MERKSFTAASPWRTREEYYDSPSRLIAKGKENERSLRKRLGESRRTYNNNYRRTDAEVVADLSDFISDRFFGSSSDTVKYDLVGSRDAADAHRRRYDQNTSRLTQEWLEEAQQIVSSPSFRDSPSRRLNSSSANDYHIAGGPSILNVRRECVSQSDGIYGNSPQNKPSSDADAGSPLGEIINEGQRVYNTSNIPPKKHRLSASSGRDTAEPGISKCDSNASSSSRFSGNFTPRSTRSFAYDNNISAEIYGKGKHENDPARKFGDKNPARAAESRPTENQGRFPAAAVHHWLASVLNIGSQNSAKDDQIPKNDNNNNKLECSSLKPPKPASQHSLNGRRIPGNDEEISRGSIVKVADQKFTNPALNDVLRSRIPEDKIPVSDLSTGSSRSSKNGRSMRSNNIRNNDLQAPNEGSLKGLMSRQLLSPPRIKLRESVHGRSVSDSTCSFDRSLRHEANSVEAMSDIPAVVSLNNFLKKQRTMISSAVAAESVSVRANIVLSGPDQSTSSMVAAICYAWLLENNGSRRRNAVPVMNTKRRNMWENRQAAWLFHDTGIDARALLFSDEVDLENLARARQHSIVVIGQDALQTNDEVSSSCTALMDEYCKQADDLVQARYIRKLLLAGILLDTQNLDAGSVLFTTRDVEAVDFLLVGMSPNHKNTYFDLLNQENNDSSFEEALLYNYGEPFNDVEEGNGESLPQEVNKKVPKKGLTKGLQLEDKPRSSKATFSDGNKSAQHQSLSSKSSKSPAPSASASGGKSKINQTLARWFGFGSR